MRTRSSGHKAVVAALAALYAAWAPIVCFAATQVATTPISPLEVIGASQALPPTGRVVLSNGQRMTVAQYFAQKRIADITHGLRFGGARSGAVIVGSAGPRGATARLADGKSVSLDAVYTWVNNIKAVVESHGCAYDPKSRLVNLDRYCGPIAARAPRPKFYQTPPRMRAASPAGTPSTLCTSSDAGTPLDPAASLKVIETQVGYIQSFQTGTVPTGVTRASLPYCADLVALETQQPTGSSPSPTTIIVPFGKVSDKASFKITTSFAPDLSVPSFSNTTSFDATLYGQSVPLIKVIASIAAPPKAQATGKITASAFSSSTPFFQEDFQGTVAYEKTSSDASHNFTFCKVPVVGEKIGAFTVHADVQCTGSDAFGYSVKASPQLTFVNASPHLDAALNGNGELSVVAASITLVGKLRLATVDANLGGVIGLFNDPFINNPASLPVAVYRPYGFYKVTLFSGQLSWTGRVLGAQLATGTFFNIKSQPLVSDDGPSSNWRIVRLH